MKKVIFLLPFIFLGLFSCTNDGDENQEMVGDPNGTITVFLKHSYLWTYPSGYTMMVTPRIYWIGDSSYDPYITLGDGYNFFGYNKTVIADVGEVRGLGNVRNKDVSSWDDKVAVIVGHGYVVQIEKDGETSYGRMYVVSHQSDGAYISYQYPF